MHRFPQHQKIIEKYAIEIYTPPPPYFSETIISHQIPELIFAIKEREHNFFHIKDHFIPQIRNVKKGISPPMLAEWSGEGYFLNIYPTMVTSGFWYAEEEPDYEDLNYRGKDTVPIDDFLDICDFYLDFLMEKFKWAFQIWNQLNQEVLISYKKEIEENRLLFTHSFYDTHWNLSLNNKINNRNFYFNFSRKFQFINVHVQLKVAPQKRDSSFFRINNLDRYYINPIFKNIVSNLIDDQKISFSKAYIELMDIDARHLSFENKKSHDDFLNKMKGGQSSFCPTNGAFKFQVLKTMLSAKNFHKVTQHFNFEKKDESFRTLDQREIFYTILLDNIDLKEYSLYIISHGKINRTHFKISFLGHWKILL